MTNPAGRPVLSRRGFLGGTVATGTLASVAAPLSAASPSAAVAPTPAYGPPAGIAKLDANENPYGPSANALRQMFEASKQGAYYVRDSVKILKSLIAERHRVAPEQVTLSSGSSGVLTYVATHAAAKGGILCPDLFWDSTARRGTRHAGRLVRLPGNDALAIDLEAMYDAISPEISLVQVTNPNNPTGTVLDGEALRAFCRKASKEVTVLVDEAYNELTDRPDYYSMVDLVREGHDVIVARTFSKIYGLAGMRVGYAISSAENAAMISSYALGDYTLNQAGLAAAIASYNDEAFLELSKSRIIEAREMISTAVRAAGLRALPSAANFVFVDLGTFSADTFREKMAARSVLIRGSYGDYRSWSRVSMGRIEDVQRYVEALPAVLDEMGA
ncbi:MAG TPA: histidinol-phosphate transaminase [Pseudomonadales bacterium]